MAQQLTRLFERLLRLLFHPMTFAIGFIAPLTSQVLVATNQLQPGPVSLFVGLLVGTVFGLMAMYRGSWLWIK